MSPRTDAWRAARHVLAVRLDALGDVLMTTPALRALKAARDERRLTLLTSSAGARVARLVPEIDDVIVYESPWMKATAPRGDSAPDHAMAARLRRRRFDAAAIFTVYSQSPLPSALLCFLADIPLRLAHAHENPYQLLTDWVPDPEPAHDLRHEVRRQLDLVGTVGATTVDERLSLRVPPPARRRVRALLAGAGLADARWVAVHPGASAPSRRYPADGFAEAARRLVSAADCHIVLTGDASEREVTGHVARAIGERARSFAGQLDLGDLAALLAAAPVLISNNTGPVHIAAAVGTPVVDLYALTNPQHTPWAVPHRVLFHDVPCKNCHKSICPEAHHDCLRRVDPADVAAAALALLDRPGVEDARALWRAQEIR